MEKAPSNRLTRSAAKQINTPSKKVDHEETFDEIVEENIRHSLRKSRRKTESKRKTNGDASCMDGKKLSRNSDDVSDGNSMDGFESEGSNNSARQKTPPHVSNKVSSPTISKKSLRTRRSITPGPELESSASKKMKRSTSEGKLESGNSTPTRRRSARAKSESKDFVFTPSKIIDIEKISSLSESNSKYIHRNSALRIIDIIDEATEGEENSEYEVDVQKSSQSSPKSSKIDSDESEIFTFSQEHSKPLHIEQCSSVVNTESEKDILKADDKLSDCPHKPFGSEVDSEAVNESETNKTESKNICVNQNDSKEEEINHSSPPSVIDNLIENSSDEKSSEQVAVLPNQVVAHLISDCESVITENKNPIEEQVQVTPETNYSTDEETDKAITQQMILTKEETDETIVDENISEPSVGDCEIQQSLVDNNEPVTNSLVEDRSGKSGDDSVKINIISDDSDGPGTNSLVEDKSEKFGVDSGKINIISDDSNSQGISFETSHINEDDKADVPVEKANVSDEKADVPDEKTDVSDDNAASVDTSNSVMAVTKRLSPAVQPDNIAVTERSPSVEQLENIEITDRSSPIVLPENITVTERSPSVVQLENIAVTENNNVRPLEVQIENNTSVTQNKEVTVPEEVVKIDVHETNSSLSHKSECFDSQIDDKELMRLSDNEAIIENKHEITEPNCELESPESVDRMEVELSNTENNEECDTKNGMNTFVKKVADGRTFVINFVCDEENLKDDVVENADIVTVETEDNKASYIKTNTSGKESFNSNFESTSTIVDTEDSAAIKINFPVNTEITVQEEDNLEGEEEQVNAAVIQEPKKLADLVDYEDVISENIISENKDTNTNKKIHEQSETLIQEPVLELDKQSEPHLEENDEDNYDDETLNKINEESGSDSDIYKGMSDFGTDGDDRKDASHFEDSGSSELRSGDSEEYVSSAEGEDEEENADQENLPSSDPKIGLVDQKNGQTNDSATDEKILDTNSPITYEKALAILNKDRVKKIDHEEFFDMFTQELNRVSEESGSDSDIAIVDEYIMEPEEPPKKTNHKPNNPQPNAKQPERPPAPPPQSNQKVSSPEPFSGSYSQPIPVLHNHPQQIPRVNFSQDGLYHQYNNQVMPPVNTTRNTVMYDQYQPTSATSIPDLRMFSAHVPQDVHFSRPGMFSHTVGPSDPQLHYRGPPGLKVRSVSAMNNQQPSNAMNPNNIEPDQGASTAALEINASKHPMVVNNDNTNKELKISTATMTDNDTSFQTNLNSPPSRDGNKVNTPILELLGLNKEKLKLLKQVLGISKQSRTPPRKKKSEHLMQTYKIKPTKQHMSKKRKLDKIIDYYTALELKKQEKAFKKSLIKHFSRYSTFDESSTEHSSEETPSSSDYDSRPGPFRRGHSDENSSEGTVETGTEDRKVNLDDTSMSVTVNTRPRQKRRYRDPKRLQRTKYTSKTATVDDLFTRKKRKRAESKAHNSSNTTPESLPIRKKHKITESQLEEDSCISSESTEEESDTDRKMTQGKKQNKEQPKVLKSKSGTFTVDSLTTTSVSSDSEAPSQLDRVSEKHHMEELKRNLRINVASGKNKLSNMFSTNSFQHGKKELKRKLKDDCEETGEVRKKQAKKLKKLPTAILEELVKERSSSSRHQQVDSALEDVVPEKRGKRKSRKRALKIKSAVSEEEYIPCVTQGATQFGLSRLDKDGPLTAAMQAAKFRTDRLHGAAVQRITILDFKD